MEQFWIILLSRLARALWIEIYLVRAIFIHFWSRLARALWIEITSSVISLSFLSSRLARALWIEILGYSMEDTALAVEARESLVD